MALSWSHTVLHIKDTSGMLDFYTRVLGFEVTDRGAMGGGRGSEIIFLSQSPEEHHQLAFIPTREPGQEGEQSGALLVRLVNPLFDSCERIWVL